mmetsp:Transcript_32071/g.52010  ORF Transcript_32071/g.52010 Transcript_32071/m.52010 type:complete len:88 (-) Transcript_32071:733-996(-)
MQSIIKFLSSFLCIPTFQASLTKTMTKNHISKNHVSKTLQKASSMQKHPFTLFQIKHRKSLLIVSMFHSLRLASWLHRLSSAPFALL